MSRKQILEKAIKKAIDNGWKGVEGITDAEPYLDNLLPVLIFNHDFARSFFKDAYFRESDEFCRAKYYSSYKDKTEFKDERLWAWEYHLMQMVKSDSPIEYLEKFL